MALDPLAPVRIGLRIGIAVLRFELSVLEHLLGTDRREADGVVVVEREPDLAGWEPEAGVPTAPVPEPGAPVPEARGREAEMPAPIPEAEAPTPEPEAPPAPAEPEAAPHIETEPEAPPAPAEPEAAPHIETEPEAPPTPAEAEAAPHIETAPDLVAEFAEPGAEEGAGAQIHVEEPWEGYRRMRVADVVDRVAVAGPEALAVIQLYESTHRKRRSVLNAVERRERELANRPPAR
jgi:hypothetical protein